ncbi:hypothetical protein J3A72_000455 [Stenotrophomonas sp. PvP093]|uniref:hypothetical protein n=1 Tax=unclassified Stenotrophomonas TaxID=196198 RepID=UPI001AE1648B|nr:hypothetical protein [Stenotrophomonas sp. PvP093]MBP2480163.1 hypothetical protein [Stenotrophomonas sp. PvP093]
MALTGLQPAIGAAGAAGSRLPCSWPRPPGRPRPAAWLASQPSGECQQLLPQLLALAGLQPAIGAAGTAGSRLPCSGAKAAARPRPAAWPASQPSSECPRLRRQRPALQLAAASRTAAPGRVVHFATFG